MPENSKFDVAAEARRIYDDSLRVNLERDHTDEFVAIEPISGEYFLSKTLSEAMGAARAKYSTRLAHVMRVGHRAGVRFGLSMQSKRTIERFN